MKLTGDLTPRQIQRMIDTRRVKRMEETTVPTEYVAMRAFDLDDGRVEAGQVVEVPEDKIDLLIRTRHITLRKAPAPRKKKAAKRSRKKRPVAAPD